MILGLPPYPDVIASLLWYIRHENVIHLPSRRAEASGFLEAFRRDVANVTLKTSITYSGGVVMVRRPASRVTAPYELTHRTVVMIFITHQEPKGLQVDEVVNMGHHAIRVILMKKESL